MLRILVVFAIVGCGAEPSSDDTAAVGSFPADGSVEGISAYVASGAWRDDGWVAETEAPREPNSDVSPHGRVRVWLNDVLVASQEAGNGEYQGTAHDAGSMAVKVLYDDADVEVGQAVMLKLDGDAFTWAYWCLGPADRCGVTAAPTEPDPYYGVATDAECGFCHGGLVFNTL